MKKSNLVKSKNLISEINKFKMSILTSRQVKENLLLLLSNSGLPKDVVKDLSHNVVDSISKGETNQYQIIEDLILSLKLLFDDTIDKE